MKKKLKLFINCSIREKIIVLIGFILILPFLVITKFFNVLNIIISFINDELNEISKILWDDEIKNNKFDFKKFIKNNKKTTTKKVVKEEVKEVEEVKD